MPVPGPGEILVLAHPPAGARAGAYVTYRELTIQNLFQSRYFLRLTRLAICPAGSAFSELFCAYSSGNAVVYLMVSIAKLELTSESSAVLISRL
jgi:hypothetical protein